MIMKFNGYRRPDGRVGIRNHIVVMPGVLCSAVAARQIVNKAGGATFLYNPNGCAQCHKDTLTTLEILSGMIANGNVYGALIVGLGCETTQKNDYIKAIQAKTNKPLYYISMQEEGGVQKTVEAGVKIVETMKQEAAKCVREEVDIAELILGLECGGSDPTSGFSANTVLGHTCDRIIDLGGSAVISETSEAIGAEHILKARGRTADIGQRIYDTIVQWEEDRYKETGEDVRTNNPAPGNKAGGLTTLSEKSLGCIHKAGTRPFDGVYGYGEMIDKKGLFFMDTCAYDVASVTAEVAGGAQIVAFTTGRGTPTGNPIAPVVKITGNHETFVRLNDMTDFDTSASITGAKPFEQLGEELLHYIISVCNGETVKAEEIDASDVSINQNYSLV